MKSVYLAGQITPNKSTLTWRQEAQDRLEGAGMLVLSPMRGKENLWDDPKFHESAGMQATSGNNSSIMLRDFNDVKISNLILANMHEYDPDRGLQGTLFELAWSWEHRKPVIAFGGTPRQQQHPFLDQAIAEWHSTLDSAVQNIIAYWRTR